MAMFTCTLSLRKAVKRMGKSESTNPKMGLPATPYLQVVKGLRDLLLEFWDPLHIPGTVEARNFKYGTHIDTV